VKSYDIAWRVTTRNSAGARTLGPLQTWRTATTATSAVFGRSGSPVKPVPGVTYRFSVRAHDDAGQTGAWSRTATTGIPLDDRATALHYTGTWKSASAASAWAGTVRTFATKGACVSFTANGIQLRVVAPKKANGGRFAVVVDGRTVGTVDHLRGEDRLPAGGVHPHPRHHGHVPQGAAARPRRQHLHPLHRHPGRRTDHSLTRPERSAPGHAGGPVRAGREVPG